jgi:two-component system, OmpR family, phosphate regulon sensor histidine kinase PhoR
VPLEVVLVAFGGAVAGFVVARFALRPVVPAAAVPAEQLAVPDSRFEQLLRSLTVGIVTVDGGGHLDSVNAAAGAIFDFGSRPVLGRAVIEVVPSFDLDLRVREALAGHPSRGRISLSGPNGARVLTVATIPLDGSDGVLVIATDETRLHELEQTRRDFVSSVSHELRTPLSSINLMIETILANDEDDEALKLFLPRVKREVDRMVQLVEDLLDLARSEWGRLRLRREDVDLSSVAGNIMKTFEPRAAQLGVKLSLEGSAARIDGDPDRLAQVLVNLIDNALRHTPSGGSVTISVEQTDGAAMLVVKDTGVGIPFNDLPHVFDRFYVVDRSRARDASGTGLGLSIVKQIIEAHGGMITADSEFGLGATFRCVFPTAKSTIVANAASRTKTAGA